MSWRTSDHEFDGELEELPSALERRSVADTIRERMSIAGVAGGAAEPLLAHGSSRRLDEGHQVTGRAPIALRAAPAASQRPDTSPPPPPVLLLLRSGQTSCRRQPPLVSHPVALTGHEW